MGSGFRRGLWLLAALVGFLGVRSLEAPGQPQGGNSDEVEPRVTADRFEFIVIQSRDALYLGDTVSHWGRYGGLGDRRPNVALQDFVYRGTTKVGTITALEWERDKGSLAVEFDPEPFQRIAVGDLVWIRLGGPRPSETAEQ